MGIMHLVSPIVAIFVTSKSMKQPAAPLRKRPNRSLTAMFREKIVGKPTEIARACGSISTASSSGFRLQHAPNIYEMFMGKSGEEIKKLKPAFTKALAIISDDDLIDQGLAYHAKHPVKSGPNVWAHQVKLKRMTDDQLIEYRLQGIYEGEEDQRRKKKRRLLQVKDVE